VRLEPPMLASIEACITRHAALLSPPLPVSSLPLPLPSPLTTGPTDTGAPLGYRATGIRMRSLFPSTSRGTDVLEVDVPPWKRACLTTPAPRFEVGESSAAEIVDTLMEIALTTLEGDDRALLRARVNTLFRDRPDYRRTAMLLDREAMYAPEAWAGSEDRSAAIATRVRTLEAQVAALIAQNSLLRTQHAALLSPPLPVSSLPLPLPSPLTTGPTDTGAPLGYRATGIRMRSLFPSTSRGTDVLEVDVPPWKRACLTTPAPRFEVGESSAAGAARQPWPTESDLRRCRDEQTGYGITNT
nr:hypothetical protein [Tanacetum cinerariifolium]